MIICQTPFRVSFFGGGTDYPTWYRNNGGAVLSTAINKFGYITCRQLPPFFEHKHRIVYSQIENITNIDQIKHPAVRAVFNEMKISHGLEIHYDGDLPARSGIGSSSSFTVGLLNALSALRGNIRSKQELAEQAIHIEQNVIHETVGSQDQIAAAFGGFNRIDFHRDDNFSVTPIVMPVERKEELNNHLLLFFTGFSRIAATVAKAQVENFGAREKQLHRMRQMVDEAQSIFQNRQSDLRDIGRMLHEAWCLKKELSEKVSNSSIDEIYNVGIENGAIGGKVLGAGGGGFVLYFAPPETHAKIREKLSHLIEVDFRFEQNGSRIIVYNPQTAIYRGSCERSWAE